MPSGRARRTWLPGRPGRSGADGWTLSYDHSGSQKLTDGWNGTWSQSGSEVTVKNAGGNGSIAAGGAVTTGAQFSYSDTNTAPAAFAVNGKACMGAYQPPIAVLTAAEAGAVLSVGDAVPLAAAAAAADGAEVSKVEFYDDTTLLGTDTTSPYTFDAEGLTAGGHSVYARAYDSLGASAESPPAGITVTAGPAVLATPAQLGAEQGESSALEVSLPTAPDSPVTVKVARSAGNSGLGVTGGTSLTFTSSNWSTPQKVTVSADGSGTGAATFAVTAPGHSKSEATVTQLAEAKEYDARFLDLYGKLTGDWAKFNGAWEIMETYMIPTHADQPTNSFYDASPTLPSNYAAKSGDAEAKATAEGLLDGMWTHYQDDAGVAVPETRADYNRFDDPVYVPDGWTGAMPSGDTVDNGSTFLSIRSFYKDDPNWSKVQAYLDGGAAPVFTYHRFWAQTDVALALGAYADLLE
ncbi:glycoside hydrolase family 48 protein [Streptomyces sp. NPDC102441]|uniref:glycoside hydrolase family 48 protein n=1 Tax=Streptomyces sp. NPDC102441 TaxID=3366176 RepID=UPI003807CEDA